MGASIGGPGTATAKHHLRLVFVFLNMYPISRPEVPVSDAIDKIDEHGRLTDEATRAQIHALMKALISWTERFERTELITY